ncbi:glycoside hydrolase family 95 protein [Flavobacteriaceae bacterium F89]|uniref:Glycoside hydrolase family 95 protein n=1 Tax=Cerina litoralis TaxID=2874477 RepID=A0AAE3ETA4_9FLAO|nr:glycoside hydrolase family 95 protein [Cerina litoralis]MCG2460730.1 glycoside hydrolase family 95 protein [Cerina litoralis]
MKQIKRLIPSLLGLTFFCCQNQEMTRETNEVWYAQPATKWMQALPVGNGRMGAMVFGDPNHERIQLNEDSMWPGGPDWENSKGSPKDLEEIRQLLKDGKPHEADKLIVEKFSYKSILRSHQTMGDLYIDFKKDKKVGDYKRALSLDDALVTTHYVSGGNNYTEKVFASYPDDVLVVELATTAPNGMDLSLRLDRPDDRGHETVTISNPSDSEISMKGMVTQYGGIKESKPFPLDYGVKFETRLQVKNESGTVVAHEGRLALKGVKKATLYIVCNTSFYQEDYESRNRETLTALNGKSFDALLEDHREDYQNLYSRMSFDLGGKALDSLPTDTRLTRIKEGGDDPDLAAKLFQFGRYLLISSSRPGSNPANLQGLWNEHIEAPWNADYHLNINLQMNYWPVEVTNLSECHEPIFAFADRLMERGHITAKEQYGIGRGSMAHHATDLWAPAFMRAEKPYWGAWIHGGGWLVQDYWEHYQYTQNKEFLKKEAYPALRTISEFYLDWLVLDKRDGTWVSAPETSPENSYIAADGKPAAVSFGAAMGHQIIAEVFNNTLKAAKILNIDDSFTKEVKNKRAKLHPGVVIGDDGRILEWDRPYEEAEKGHRHMSHLYALHPGDQITESDTTAFKAAQKTIDFRLQHGGAGTGWSRAWMINLNARLLDPVSAEENIKKFLQISVADNLFDEHPPFQIDGNFGYTAAVAELLMQSHEGFIRILPALPSNWKNGKIAGLKARGNLTVDLEWKDGRLVQLGLTPGRDKMVKLKYGSTNKEVQLQNNKKTILNANLETK